MEFIEFILGIVGLLFLGFVANVIWTIAVKIFMEKPMEVISSVIDRKVCHHCGAKNKPISVRTPPPSSHMQSHPEDPVCTYAEKCYSCGQRLEKVSSSSFYDGCL